MLTFNAVDAPTGASNVIWPAWNNVTAGTTSITWSAWNYGAQISSTVVWTNWAAGTGLVVPPQNTTWGGWTNIQFNAQVHRKLTTEEERARAQEQLRYEEERKKRALELDAAKGRARKLLFDHLDEEQKREATEFKRFHLRTRSGRLFRVLLGTGRHGNIKELDGDKVVRSFCAAPNGSDLPEDDAILAQKLALEHDEVEFLKVANMTPVRAVA